MKIDARQAGASTETRRRRGCIRGNGGVADKALQDFVGINRDSQFGFDLLAKFLIGISEITDHLH